MIFLVLLSRKRKQPKYTSIPHNCIKRSDVFSINFLEIPNITKNSFLGCHLSYFVLANFQFHRYDSFVLLKIKKYLIKSILKKTKISKTENNNESDRAGNGNVDDDNDSSDDIDNEGRDDDTVGGDTNDDGSDDDKSNEGGDSNDEGGGDGGITEVIMVIMMIVIMMR